MKILEGHQTGAAGRAPTGLRPRAAERVTSRIEDWARGLSAYHGRGRIVAPVVVALVVLSVPLWQSGFQIERFSVSLLYVACALGLNTLFGYAGEFSFAPGIVMGLSAYTTGILTVHAGLAMVPAMLLSILGGLLGSVLIHLSGLRVRGWYFALTSFFALLVFPNVVNLLPKLTGGVEGLTGLPTLRPFDSPGSDGWSYEIIAVCVLVLIGLFRFLLRARSRIRLAFLTLHYNPRACSAVGISTVRVKLLAYLLAGLPFGVAGVLLAHLQGSVAYSSFGLGFAIALFAGVILGRPGNFWGPLLGVGAVYGISLWIGPFSSYNPLILAGAIMVVALVVPHGRTAMRRPRTRAVALEPTTGVDRRSGAEVPQAGHGAFARRTISAGPTEPVAGSRVGTPIATAATHGRDLHLEVTGVRKSFGAHVVLRDVKLGIRPGEIVGLLGANGSGKTTLLNVLSGLVHPEAGQVLLGGHSLVGMSPTAISRAGLARTFQVPEVVEVLTVRENIEIATFGGTIVGRYRRAPNFGALGGAGGSSRASRETSARIAEWLGLPTAVVDRRCGELSLGVRRIVEIGRAVGFGATLMCLDEPAAGLNPEDGELVATALRQFSTRSDCAMLVVEHNPGFILGLADRVLLLEEGEVVDEHRRGEVMSAKLESFLALEDVSVARP